MLRVCYEVTTASPHDSDRAGMRVWRTSKLSYANLRIRSP